jgi:hypothetical protein
MSEEKRLALCQQIIDWAVELIKAFIESQRVKLLAPLLDDLGDRGSDTPALIAQQREQSHCGAADFLREIDERGYIKWGEQH